ncbi:hypothetical protein ACFOKF_03225 [Sphingobium rhizovicinum]|uniref:Lipoprotein n=1 Tax=Sphingobium rhizovicinum TaxID=432308 RepID=A0ABV7NBV0_9SPHN
MLGVHFWSISARQPWAAHISIAPRPPRVVWGLAGFGFLNAKADIDPTCSVMHRRAMKNFAILSVGPIFLLSACLNNPTIDEEIAGRCGISVGEYQNVESKLNRSRDGASVLAGHCRLTRTAKDVIEGTVIDNAL